MSSLLSVRNMFINATGRFDLVDSAGGNISADWYINAGQKMLDDMTALWKNVNKVTVPVRIGQDVVSVQDCRSILGVYVSTAESQWKLLKVDRLYDAYGVVDVTSFGISNRAWDSNTYGLPTKYSIIVNAVAPKQNNAEGNNTQYRYDMQGVIVGDHYQTKSILFSPPAGQEYTITVEGQFYSPTLVGDSDKSYWTEVYPHLLVASAGFQLETMMRNTEGANDWMNSIRAQLVGLDKNEALEDSAEINCLEG